MKILFITQWFDPEPTFKGLLFARALQRQGHQVTVVTGFPNYPDGKVYPGFRVRPLSRETIDGVRILRVALYPSHDNSRIGRVANYMSFACSASIGAILLPRPDVAYVYHPPATSALPALLLKWIRGVPFVYDVQDLWPDTLSATGMVSNNTVLGLAGRALKVVYGASGGVVVLSDGFRQALVGRGVPPRKITVIRNWGHEGQIVLPSDSEPGHGFTIVFAGTMGKAQGLDVVLDAAHHLRSTPDVKFVMMGGGVERHRLQARAQEMGLANVEFLPRRPPSEVGEVLARADAVLVHLNDDPLFRITIPSKIQDYLMVGRPILAGVAGDAADLVLAAGAGLTFSPGRSDQLVNAILQMQNMSKSHREQYGINGAAYYREELSLDAGARRFAEVFEQAFAEAPRSVRVKRGLDIVGAVVLGSALALPAAALALLIRTRLGSPTLFRQPRTGLLGQTFEIIKFRTMTDEEDAAGIPLPDSERLTRLGAALRTLSLDEVPELWNVLKGDMSLVGPRPLLPRYTPHFRPDELPRLDVRPGITGWAQVNGRNSAAWNDRLRLDAWYAKHHTIWLDLKIMALTAVRVLRRSGVVVDPTSQMQDLDVERQPWRAAS